MKNVSKFFVAGFSALTIAFTPIAVNAAPSPTVQGIVSTGTIEAIDQSGKKVEVIVKSIEKDPFANAPEEKREVYINASKEITKKENIQEILTKPEIKKQIRKDIEKSLRKSLKEELSKISDEKERDKFFSEKLDEEVDKIIKNIVIIDVKDVEINGDPSMIDWPLKVEFELEGITEETTLFVLHYDGEEWEKVPSKVKNGAVEATFDSLSPVAFVADKTTLAGAEKIESTDEEVVVEETEQNTSLVMPITIAGVIVVAVLFFVVTKKKSK